MRKKRDPNNSYQCPFCFHYFNGESAVAIYSDNMGNLTDCAHGKDKEILPKEYGIDSKLVIQLATTNK